MKRRLFILACSFLCIVDARAFGETPGTSPDRPSAGAIAQGQRVFTCGHSFHAFFIAPILQDMARAAGIKEHAIVGVSKIGASKAIQHWDVPDEKNEAKAALRAGKVDVLTLSCLLHPDPGIDRFAELAFANNPKVRVSLQESWMPFEKYEWPFTGDPAAVNFDAATAESLRALHEAYFKEMDAFVNALNARLGRTVVFVSPAGQAVVALRAKVIAGKVPGIEKQSELFSDKLGHPREPLQALVAYTQFAVIYRRSPVGLPVPSVLAQSRNPNWKTDALNRILQETAWEAVTQHPLSGVKAEAAR
jgi:hypothetical protein